MNFESDNAKHLQIVLTGQPELRDKLNQPGLRQLKQRVALRCKMHSLPNVEEVERYIIERLSIAGSDQPNIFTPGAIDFIFQCSEGIPRLINNLCDNALLTAYAAGDSVVSRQVVEEVADNLDLLPRNEQLLASEKPVEKVLSGGILTAEAREEMWQNQTRAEAAVKPKKPQPQIAAAKTNGNGAKKTNSDDEILEIEEVGGFY